MMLALHTTLKTIEQAFESTLLQKPEVKPTSYGSNAVPVS